MTKREILSAVIGAVVAGSFCLMIKSKPEKIIEKEVVFLPEKPYLAQDSSKKPLSQDSVLLKKSREKLSNVFSAQPQQGFAGFDIYDTDFLIPLRSMVITDYHYCDELHEDDPMYWGTGGAPSEYRILNIKNEWFLTVGYPYSSIDRFVYLGNNIQVVKAGYTEDSDCYEVIYNMNGKEYFACIAPMGISKGRPDKKMEVAFDMEWDGRRKLVEPPDEEPLSKDMPYFFQCLQDAVRKGDKEKVAGMIDFPIGNYYTRAEFIRDYDKIINFRKEELLKKSADDIMYSWRGALLPGGFWCRDASEKQSAGAITAF